MKKGNDMSEEIFRKKSLERIKSPEELNDIIKVANPGVWLLLFGTVLILIGACIWGIFGTVESTAKGSALVQDGTAAFFVQEGTSLEALPETVVVTLEGQEVSFPRYAFSGAELPSMDDGSVFIGTAPVSLSDGIYPVTVLMESIHPVTFILN